MKKKIAGIALALTLSTAQILSLSGCGIISDIAGQQQGGPINSASHEKDDDEKENGTPTADVEMPDDTESEATAGESTTTTSETTDVAGPDITIGGSEPSSTESADNTPGDAPKDYELTFDPSDRPNANTGYGNPTELREGSIAPDFTVSLTNGGTFTLSDYDYGVVMVNFWATWCGPCVGEMPEIAELASEGIENFTVVCVNLGEDTGTVDNFVSDNGYNFNIGYDTDYTVSDYYPTDYVPYTVIIQHGIVKYIYVGAPADAYGTYKDAVLSLLD